jgi:protein-tyrosine phosphatase
MRQVAGRSLWIGNAGDLQNPRALLGEGIEAVVELGDSEPFVALPRDLVRCRFPLADGGENPPWLLRLAIDCVAAMLHCGVPIIVCCSAGMSRSICVAAAGIAINEGLSLPDALSKVISEGPADVSPGFLAQVQQALDGQSSSQSESLD